MQNFDIVKLEKVVDWFNVMTYDLHGTWWVGSSSQRFGPFFLEGSREFQGFNR